MHHSKIDVDWQLWVNSTGLTMSALCRFMLQFQTYRCVAANGRNGPLSDSCGAAISALFDHLVGGDKETSGIVKPRFFADLRLRTVSYFVGVCTGRLPGLAPRRI